MSAIEVAPVEQAAAVLGSLARRDVPIGPMTTYRVGGAAALFVRASSIEDLRVVAAAVQASAVPVLARRTAAASLTGLEWAVGVPGSVGGAVRMNAGGHGSDVAATLQSVDLVDLATGAEALGVPAERLGLRFRGSSLGDLQIVVRARFRLAAGDRAASEREIAEIVRWRREHQPGGQNAGSVFVNPIPGQLAAGELVDDLGPVSYTHLTLPTNSRV